MYEKGNNNGAVDTYNVFKIIISKCILEMNIIYIYSIRIIFFYFEFIHMNIYAIIPPAYHSSIINFETR